MKNNVVYTARPTDQEPVYYEAPASIVVVPKGRLDFTMRDVLRTMSTRPVTR